VDEGEDRRGGLMAFCRVTPDQPDAGGFAVEGQVHDVTISERDSVFGAVNADSGYAGGAPSG